MRLQRAVPFDIVQTAACIAIAAALATVVRPATAELTHTLGTVWPFSLLQYRGPAAPVCAAHAAFGVASR